MASENIRQRVQESRKTLESVYRINEDELNKIKQLPIDQLKSRISSLESAVDYLRDSTSNMTNNYLASAREVIKILNEHVAKHPDEIRKKTEENRIREEANHKIEEDKKRTDLDMQQKYSDMQPSKSGKLYRRISLIPALISLFAGFAFLTSLPFVNINSFGIVFIIILPYFILFKTSKLTPIFLRILAFIATPITQYIFLHTIHSGFVPRDITPFDPLTFAEWPVYVTIMVACGLLASLLAFIFTKGFTMEVYKRVIDDRNRKPISNSGKGKPTKAEQRAAVQRFAKEEVWREANAENLRRTKETLEKTIGKHIDFK